MKRGLKDTLGSYTTYHPTFRKPKPYLSGFSVYDYVRMYLLKVINISGSSKLGNQQFSCRGT